MALESAFKISMTWGSLRLWAASIDTKGGRTKVVHRLTSGDEHPVDDRGLQERRYRYELLFDDMPDDPLSAEERLRRLDAAVKSGADAILSHPIDGTFLAGVGEFEYRIDASTNVESCTIEFIPTGDVAPISPAGGGTGMAAGELAVNAAADELDSALLEVGLELSTVKDVREAVASWSEPEFVPTRQIIAQTADLSAQLVEFLNEGGLEDDLAYFDVWRSTVLLGDALRAAALAATAQTPAVFRIRVTTQVALLALMAELYGGADALDFARQALELNDIATPGWLPVGEYVLPIPPPTVAAI